MPSFPLFASRSVIRQWGFPCVPRQLVDGMIWPILLCKVGCITWQYSLYCPVIKALLPGGWRPGERQKGMQCRSKWKKTWNWDVLHLQVAVLGKPWCKDIVMSSPRLVAWKDYYVSLRIKLKFPRFQLTRRYILSLECPSEKGHVFFAGCLAACGCKDTKNPEKACTFRDFFWCFVAEGGGNHDE